MAIDKLDNITTAEVKAYHGITGTDKDSRIDVIRPLVSSIIKNYCRHDFESKSRSEYPYIEPNRDKFYTLYRPISSVTSLVVDGTTYTEDTDYYVYKETGMIEKLKATNVFVDNTDYGYWTTEKNKILITYIGGEALTADVVLVFYELCGIYAQLKTKTFINEEGIQAAVTMTSLPKEIMDVLERHKWQRVL